MRVAYFFLGFLGLICSQAVIDVEHSLKPPFMHGPMTSLPPGWEFYGSTVVDAKRLFLTSLQNHREGAIWNTNPISSKTFEVQTVITISGMKLLGGDGMAFWFCDKPYPLGSVMGGPEDFTGMAILLDTFANSRNNFDKVPRIQLLGSTHGTYDEGNDGISSELAGCRARMRNAEYVTLQIRYADGRVHVGYDINRRDLDQDPRFTPCFVWPIQLPDEFYVGISAKTGDVADIHQLTLYTFDNKDQSKKISSSDFDASFGDDSSDLREYLRKRREELQIPTENREPIAVESDSSADSPEDAKAAADLAAKVKPVLDSPEEPRRIVLLDTPSSDTKDSVHSSKHSDVSDLSEVFGRLDELEKLPVALDLIQSLIVELNSSYSRLKAVVSKTNVDLDQIQSATTQRSSEIEALSEEMQKLHNDVISLTMRIATLDSDLQSFAEVVRMSARMADVEPISAKVDSLITRLNHAEARIGDLHGHVGSSVKKSSNLGKLLFLLVALVVVLIGVFMKRIHDDKRKLF